MSPSMCLALHGFLKARTLLLSLREYVFIYGFPSGLVGKESASNAGDPSSVPGLKGMATHSSTLAWRIPWTEEPGRLQSMGSPRVGHDCATNFHFHIYITLSKCSQTSWVQIPAPGTY